MKWRRRKSYRENSDKKGWDIWFHSYISMAVWGGGNARYRNNPYGLVSSAKDFFGSEEAWKYQQKLYRYMIARWGYSRALFLRFVADEINGTEDWTEGDRSVAEQWRRKMDEYLNKYDPRIKNNRRPCTSYR